MRQFDVCRLKDRGEQLVVVLQHDMADELATRVVAPLSDRSFRKLITRLRPIVTLNGENCVLQLDRLAAIQQSAIGFAEASVAADELRIKNALDLLFFGV